jgi:hypothetical protein
MTPHAVGNFYPRGFRPPRVHTWAMTVSVSLSTRVSPQVRDRLAAEAQEHGMPLSAYTRTLLSGASPADASPGGGAVVDEVEWVFAHLPQEAWLRREICLALARTVQGGGSAGIAAGRELLYQVQVTRSLFDYEDDDDGDDGAEAIPSGLDQSVQR